eukprot:2334442-Pleurochrysis_carterae.AAC.3
MGSRNVVRNCDARFNIQHGMTPTLPPTITQRPWKAVLQMAPSLQVQVQSCTLAQHVLTLQAHTSKWAPPCNILAKESKFRVCANM